MSKRKYESAASAILAAWEAFVQGHMGSYVGQLDEVSASRKSSEIYPEFLSASAIVQT